MGDPRGFLKLGRKKNPRRPIDERLKDWNEFEIPLPTNELKDQASRCMDCGIPFCHKGCPLGNLIPDWNDLVHRGRYDQAIVALESTNNFPEMTGRICPAPCEAACVVGLNRDPVTIKQMERGIADGAYPPGPLPPQIPGRRTGRSVAVVGSGPAGMAAAQQLARAGHSVTLFEKADRIGGLLRYGIPDFKMEKDLIDRRMDQMQREGVQFRTSCDVGVDITAQELRQEYDAVVLCGGAGQPRDLPVPGRELEGVHFAMDFLTQQNKRVAGDSIDPSEAISAKGKKVLVLGGGDTGSDCLGTSLRQGVAEVVQLEFMPAPPEVRAMGNPWPEWPFIYRTSSSQEEGGERLFALRTTDIMGKDGRLTGIRANKIELKDGRPVDVEGEVVEIECDLMLLAIGFVGPSRPSPLLDDLGVDLDERGNVHAVDYATSVPGVYAAGDVRRGQSLVVWAIAEGRQAAEQVDKYLSTKAVARARAHAPNY